MSNNKIPRILLASNSQGTSAGVSQEQSYPSVLQERLGPEFEVHRILISGWTLRDFSNNLTDNVLAISPDFVVMHFGIIESAQRILSNWEKGLLSLVPLGGRITGFLHHHRAAVLKLRHSLGLQARQVSLPDYSASVRDVANNLGKLHIPYLFLRIPLFPDDGDAVGHPFINQDVATFNGVLNEYASISFDACTGGWTMSDYQHGTVHFSEAGHGKVAELLMREIMDRLR